MFQMIAKRVIPCLDVHDGQVTRGVQFGRAEAGELRNVGDPVELALRYNDQGADEMVFFDITASAHGRETMVSVIERTADQCFMPLTVGGGLRSVEDIYTMLRGGRPTKSALLLGTGKSRADSRRCAKSSAASALSFPLTPKKWPPTGGRSFRTVAEKRLGWKQWNGHGRQCHWARARSC